jgi:cytoskeleton protein RodZ
MSPLGPDLRSAREAKGISLEEIAAATRISLRYLKALEEGDLTSFPSEFFARSVVRSYAKAVGLDEKDALERYRALGLKTGSGRKPLGEAPQRLIVAKAGHPYLMNAAFFLFGIAIIALTLFVFLKNRGERPLASPTAAQTEAPSSLPVQVPIKPPAAEVAAPAPDKIQGLRLDLAFSESTWIQVFADGAVKLDGIEASGASVRIEARSELLIHLGNAGGVSGVLNGKPLKPFGRSGAVVKNIRVTPANLGDFWK